MKLAQVEMEAQVDGSGSIARSPPPEMELPSCGGHWRKSESVAPVGL